MLTISTTLDCKFVFDRQKGQKLDQRICFKFCVKNEIKCTGIFGMLTMGLTSLLRAEHKFNCGITGLRKVEKMTMTMLVNNE